MTSPEAQRLIDMAHKVIDLLAEAYTKNDAQAGAYLASQVYQANDPDLLMLVLGRMVTRMVDAERRLDAPDAPMVTGDADGPEMIWGVGVRDQIEAAAEAGDSDLMAQIMVEGQVRACRQDYTENGSLSLADVVSAMMRLDRPTLTLVAAEAVRRLARG